MNKLRSYFTGFLLLFSGVSYAQDYQDNTFTTGLSYSFGREEQYNDFVHGAGFQIGLQENYAKFFSLRFSINATHYLRQEVSRLEFRDEQNQQYAYSREGEATRGTFLVAPLFYLRQKNAGFFVGFGAGGGILQEREWRYYNHEQVPKQATGTGSANAWVVCFRPMAGYSFQIGEGSRHSDHSLEVQINYDRQLIPGAHGPKLGRKTFGYESLNLAVSYQYNFD